VSQSATVELGDFDARVLGGSEVGDRLQDREVLRRDALSNRSARGDILNYFRRPVEEELAPIVNGADIVFRRIVLTARSAAYQGFEVNDWLRNR